MILFPFSIAMVAGALLTTTPADSLPTAENAESRADTIVPAVVAPRALGGIQGTIRSAGRPVAGAEVKSATLETGARTDSLGTFRLDEVPEGSHTVTIRAIGFVPLVRRVIVSAHTPAVLDVELVASAPVLNTIVTTGNVGERYLLDSPVKVEVLTQSYLERNATANVMDNLSFVPGLNQQVDCGVCFTNNIRINGMEGPYTAVLIDGTPMMSALATVYGLNSIDPALVQQIEIVKGPNSTVYGSEAMGGVINIITKDPRFAPTLTLSASMSSNHERNVALAAARSIGVAHGLLSITGATNQHFVDRNDDGFSDLPLVNRVSVFNKWSIGAAEGRPVELSARYYYEDRFGGIRDWTRADRGSSTVYGESIYTTRVELLGTVRFGPSGAPLRADMAFNWHDQDSYYGASLYQGRQSVWFGQLHWSPQFGAHTLGAGATLRAHAYRDRTTAHATHERRIVPGLFIQDEWAIGSDWTVLLGLRADRHAVHGVIPSPRVAVAWDASEHTTLRLTGGTGFRIVNLFTEDHAALTGARQVQIEPGLSPERSLNVAATLSQRVDVRGIHDAATIDLDLYYTRFTNRILPDYDTDPSLIIYRNLRGFAQTQGASLAVGYATVNQPLFANLGITLQRATVSHDGTRSPIAFSPGIQGVFTLGYTLLGRGMTVDWTGRVLGPMRLPLVPGERMRSPWYTEQHVQMTKTMRRGLEMFVAVKNMFDYVQRDPILDPGNPFGDRFDTARVYGPLQGRRVVVGSRLAIEP